MSNSIAPARRHFRPIEHVSNGLLILMHLAVLLAVVVPLSWKALAMMAGGYSLRMWAVTGGYHRYFAHRSYKTSRGFQFLLAALGATTMQNGPIWWASVHRSHHRQSDGPGDPHSPVLRGFWYAHLGWNFGVQRPDADNRSNVSDLTRYPELRFVDRHDWLFLIGYALLCFAIGGRTGLVWGFVVSTVAVFHATLLINSLAHTWGSRRYATGDESRNSGLLALVTFGEGWHNNHHHCPGSVRQGLFWWEIDVTYYVLRGLSWLGVVWDLRQPTAAQLAGPLALGGAGGRGSGGARRPAS
jgi:stearoyl-CoA desaturase (delta-9 desaturase)